VAAAAVADTLTEPQTMPTVECLHCQAPLDAPAEYRGRLVKCSICGKSFVLRFTSHDSPVVKSRSAGRRSEPPVELKSTVAFRLPDTPAPHPVPPSDKPKE
jgi:hypothetical protein